MDIGFQVQESKMGMLAYETGVHIGDGSMVCKPRYYRLIYAGDLENDSQWFRGKLIPTIQELYDLKPLVYKREKDGSILLVINSKRIVNFKVE